MPRKKEQFAQIREQSRNRILQCALQLFAIHGFDATSMAMIAKKAEISSGLAYNYFTSKEEILKELFQSAIQNLNDTLGKAPEIPSREACVAVMNNLADSVKKDNNLWRLMVQIMLQPDIARDFISDLKTTPASPKIVFQRYFESLNDPDANSKAEAVTALVIGTVMFQLTHGSDKDFKSALKLVADRLL